MTKTEFMLIGFGQRLITIANYPNIQVATSKCFDITTDDKLSWNYHIEKLTK